MLNHVANQTKIIDIFASYIYGNNAECTIDLKEKTVNVDLKLYCYDSDRNTETVVFEMLLTGKNLFLTFLKHRGAVTESVSFDLEWAFSYSVVKELVNNYISSILDFYKYELYLEKSVVRTIKPTAVYKKLSKYAFVSQEATLHFSSTPNTRHIAVKVPKCDIDITIDVNPIEGVNFYWIDALKTEEGKDDVHYLVDKTPDLSKAMKTTVGKL